MKLRPGRGTGVHGSFRGNFILCPLRAWFGYRWPARPTARASEKSALTSTTSPAASSGATLRVLVALAVLLTAVVTAPVVYLATRPPPGVSVVLLTMDMVRRDRFAIYGYEHGHTPTIDALARRGLVFDDAYTVSTLSGPSHASMLTGLRPYQHGLYDNVHMLLDDVRTVATSVSNNGYATGGFVSYGLVGEKVGLDRGFDHFEVNELDNHLHQPATPDDATRSYRRAANWLYELDSGDRFFLWVHAQNAHFDWNPPAETLALLDGDEPEGIDAYTCIYDVNKRNDRQPTPAPIARALERRYDGEIATIDAGLRLILDALREQGRKDVAVIVVADHGTTLFDREAQSNIDHADVFFEEVLRVPLIVSGPGIAAARVPGFVDTTQIAPTIAQLTATRFRAGRPDLLAVAAQGHGRAHFGTRTWSLDEHHAVRTGDFKLVVNTKKKTEHLYDLSVDPSERTEITTDTADAHKLAALREHARGIVGRRRKHTKKIARSPEVLELLRAGGYLDQLQSKDDR